MKTKSVLLVLALAVLRLPAETLPIDTAVFMQADAKSAVISRLPAGSTITYVGEAPAGWRRVEITGTFEGYARSHDITKGLEVREGANIVTAPEKTAPVLTVAQKGDKTEVTGLHGDFCQIRLEKKLQGFIATGAVANTPAETRPLAPVTAAPAPSDPTAPGHPVAITGNSADLPRLFTGTLVLAKRAFINPNPPYDFQLTDSNGRRFAYVDTHRLVLTDKIESYLGLQIVVTGTIRNTVDGKDLVVDAEAMQHK
ncbi:MAG: SH3 domain-containing protein [Opitutales bacterium]